MKIILSGGGTGGPVTPLLAVAQTLEESQEKVEFLWLGTRYGPEKKLLEGKDIKFRPIFSGKLRRYFCIRNFIDPILITLGFFQSLFILAKFRPGVILSAGGFVSVPAVLAGWLLRVPAVIHQQDVTPGLANKLMGPFARKITVTFEKSLKDFPEKKTIWTGNPVRKEILGGKKEEAQKLFNLEPDLPTLLVIGGGTGALAINKLVWQILPELVRFCQVVHLTGERKQFNNLTPHQNKFGTGQAIKHFENHYHPYEFLTDKMKDAYAAADLVVSRAGMGTLTELAVLGKPAILIPIPDTHQEENARMFAEKGAGLVFSQKEITSKVLLTEIKNLLSDRGRLRSLSENIKKLAQPDAARKIARIVLKLT